jgi:methionine sulfoxide reductase catalytic subunit
MTKWNVPEREITPEHLWRGRRRFLLGMGGVALGLGVGAWWWLNTGTDDQVLDAGAGNHAGAELYPAGLNGSYADLDRPLTIETEAARYTNFYEFSSTKEVWRYVKPFQPTPWTVQVDGLVARPRTYDLDDLLKAFPLQERRYRHRCVETWAMAVPWTGFSLADLLRKVEPLPGARFVRFVSFERPNEASRQRSRIGPWPYSEGLTLEEATNPLTFLATGMYGHPLLKQHGAPIRLVVPWKYGFKSAKSLVRIEVTPTQPATFWNTLVPHEYGFQANVDPDVPHPRWSQKTERMLGSGERRATQIFNGYGDWAGKLYVKRPDAKG